MLPRLGDPLPVEVYVLAGPELFAQGVAVLQRFSEEEGAPRQSPSEAQFEENGPVMVAAG